MFLDADELAAVQQTQNEYMPDTCQILTRGTSGSDPYGKPIPTWTAGADVSCGFGTISSRDVMAGTQVPLAEARLRLPLTATFTNLDRIRITKRYDAALSASEDFEIVGPARRGPSCFVVLLKRVTNATG